MEAPDILTVVLGVVLVLLVLLASSYYRKKHKAFTVFALASYCYAFVYAVVPIYYLFSGSAPDKIAWALHTDLQFQTFLIAITGYLVLIGGYALGMRYKPQTLTPKHEHLPLLKYGSWAFLAFVFGMFGVLVDISLQGGIMNSFRNIEVVRSFLDTPVKDGLNNPIVFFRMFKPFVYFSFYLYFMLAKTTKSHWHIFMSLLTFIVTAYCIFINGGRTHIFIFLATVMLGYFTSGSNKKVLFVTLIIGAASLTLLDPLFLYLTYGRPFEFNSSLSFDYLANQFSFPYSNLIYVTSHDFSYRYFQDAYLWLISILPSFVLNKMGVVEQPPLSEYNTMLQNNTMLLGGMPSDILTFGYYQFGFAGMIITVCVFGFLLSRIDHIVMTLKESVALRPIIARIVIYMGMMVMYADLEGTFIIRYDVILLLLFLSNYRKYQIKPQAVVQNSPMLISPRSTA